MKFVPRNIIVKSHQKEINMATLYGEVRKRIEQFEVHLPFAVKEIKIDDEDMLIDQLNESH